MFYHELTISIAPPFRDPLIRLLTGAGCLGVIEEDDFIVAYFPEGVEINEVTNGLSLVKTLLDKSGQIHDVTFKQALIPEQDWNASWKKGFHPIDVGERFTILPPWEKKRNGRINVIIDPAMAFGTGHHETTRSCLVLTERHAGKSGKELFLDLGTGTGILAIAAIYLGYRRVIAVDTDRLATGASRKNVELNEVKGIEIMEANIENLTEPFDFIAANLISGVLVCLAPVIAARLKPGGIAVLSGILSGQEREVLAAMTQAGLALIEHYRDGKWISLALGRFSS